MALSIKVTESKEAPPSAGSGYRHYLAGNTYGPDTDPPATPALVRRALAEGWAEAWPPAVDLAPLVETLPPLDPDVVMRALDGLPSGTLALSGEMLMPDPLPAGVEWIALPAGSVGGHEFVIEPIAATDPADPTPEPEEQAPGTPVPDVQPTPAEAPATPTKAGGKSTRKATRRGAR